VFLGNRPLSINDLREIKPHNCRRWVINIPIGIISEPSGAIVFIDGKEQGTGKQHTTTEGNHQLKLEKDGYQPLIEAIYVDANNTLFEYKLSEIEDVDLVINTVPTGAAVYIDNVMFGKTPVSDFYPAGKYPIRIEKEWYVTFEDYIEIQALQTKEDYSLNPDFGSIEVTSSPQSGMDIYFDGVAQNVKTPHTFNQLRPGLYKINARSQYYETNEVEVQLQRSKAEKVNLISEGNFAVLNVNTHELATVYLDGQIIKQLKNIRLQPSRINIEARMPKAEPVSKRLTLKKGDTLTVDLYPAGTIQIVVDPFDAKIELKGDAGEYYTSEGKNIFSDVPVGKYELIAKADKHKTYTETFTLKADEKLKKSITLIEGSDIPPNMVLVEGGTFTMGDTWGDGDNDEKPTHKVTLSSFYISKFEVTQREWWEVMGSNPSHFKGDDLPVENVTWYNATDFCNKMSLKDGLNPCYIIDIKWVVTCNFDADGYHLPTEAEWEYAARGGSKSRGYKYSGSDNIEDVAWYDDNSNEKTYQVGIKIANELGIYDMTGNVWEWCWDWYGKYSSSSVTDPKGSSSGEHRILRGGSWGSDDGDGRIANRTGINPDSWINYIGFRVIVSCSTGK